MPDNMTKKQRSRTMSKIHSRWTKQEKDFHSALKKAGISHIMHPKIPGNPDLVIPEQRIAVFLNGCFWHKCPKCYKPPKSNRNYWIPKLEKNAQRDYINEQKLRNQNWKVIVIWEHEVKKLSGDKLMEFIESKGFSLPAAKKF